MEMVGLPRSDAEHPSRPSVAAIHLGPLSLLQDLSEDLLLFQHSLLRQFHLLSRCVSV